MLPVSSLVFTISIPADLKYLYLQKQYNKTVIEAPHKASVKLSHKYES